jgi:hypothetical protein
MAYGVRYTAGASIKNSDETITDLQILLEKKNYTGDPRELDCTVGANVIARDFENLESNILGMNFEFEVRDKVEEDPDFFDLMDLMTATEREFKVTVNAFTDGVFTARIFEGFISVESTERKYLQYQSVKLLASSFLSKLKNYHTTELELIAATTFIDYITSMLREIGSASDLRINCSLIPTEDWSIQNETPGGDGYTLFNKTACNSELFWKNNVERETSYDVLDKILLSFNCYIYWWNDKWYIEHYDNIWTDTGFKNFVEYDINTEYNPPDFGVWVQEERPIMDVHDLEFIQTTQTITTIPGKKIVAIKVEDKQYDNLVPNQFEPMTTVNGLAPTNLKVRSWARTEGVSFPNLSWEDIDKPYSDITNAIGRRNTFPAEGTFIYGPAGLTCDFLVTVKPNETELNITWKHNSTFGWYPQSYLDAGYIVNFRFMYSLRIIDGVDNPWIYSVSNNPENEDGWYLRPGTVFPQLATLSIGANQTDFNQDTYTKELNVSVPLKDLNKEKNDEYPITLPFQGDYKIQLTIMDTWRRVTRQDSDYDSGWIPLTVAHDGDITVKLDGNTLDDNYIEGKNNTDFLDKQEIELSLADQSDLFYKNGIIRGDGLDTRTSTWRSKVEGDSDVPVVDRLLVNKFRFYNQTRQSIQGRVHTPLVTWKPFMLFRDTKQEDKKFVLMGLLHELDKSEHELSLLEYDNTTAVNLLG